MKEEVSRGEGIRLRARRYKWLLTLLGALLVFGTFLIKDFKREELKIMIDSTASAENYFLIRRDVAGVKDTRTRIFQVDDSPDGLETANENVGDWLSQIDGSLLNLSSLINAVPDAATEAQKSTLESLKERRTKLVTQYEKRSDDISALPEYDPKPSSRSTHVQAPMPAPSEKSPADLSQSIEGAIRAVMKLSNNVLDLSDSVLSHAQDMEKQEKEKYDNFTILSVFFYSAGWLIGLVGHFFGAEPIEG